MVGSIVASPTLSTQIKVHAFTYKVTMVDYPTRTNVQAFQVRSWPELCCKPRAMAQP